MANHSPILFAFWSIPSRFWLDLLVAFWLMLSLTRKGSPLQTGQTLAQNLAGREVYNDDVIRSKETALFPDGGMAVLRGNLCPGNHHRHLDAADDHDDEWP